MDSIDVTKGGGPSPETSASSAEKTTALDTIKRRFGGGGNNPPPTPPGDEDADPDEEGMVRMSFLEHLEELRSRIIKALIGVAVSFGISLTFSNQLWIIIVQPAAKALTSLGYPPDLVFTSPMESFMIIWFKLPLVCSLFVASPWVLYQVWAFISPGLYKRERRWAAPFILTSAGLFIGGGCFAYFVVFRYGLTFLLGISGQGLHVKPMITITEYSDMFVNVVLGVGVVFELPILIFFLTLLHVVTPAFLIRHSRYAILIIFIIAAVVTPTPDVFNMMLFALPMCGLFYVGIFAGYLLVLHREDRAFPWRKFLTIVLAVLLLLALILTFAITRHVVRVVPNWPFLVR